MMLTQSDKRPYYIREHKRPPALNTHLSEQPEHAGLGGEEAECGESTHQAEFVWLAVGPVSVSTRSSLSRHF